MITGTIRNAVKMQELNNKWLLKKSEIGKQKKELANMTPEERKLQHFLDQAADIRESNKFAKIDAKIKAGGSLTEEEKAYLKQKNPEVLKNYEEAKEEKKAYEQELKNCKTKEEVDRVKFNRMGAFMSQVKSISADPYIPKAKKLGLLEKILSEVNNVARAHYEFTHSLAYQNLPTEEEKREEEEEKKEAMGYETDLAETENTEEEKQIEENEEQAEGFDTEETDFNTPSDSEFEQIENGIREFLKKEGAGSEKWSVVV